MAKKVEIAVFYSFDDHQACESIMYALSPSFLPDVQAWHAAYKSAGTAFNEEIKQKLNSADIIIFLISQSFFESDYIGNYELPQTMERYKKKEVEVIPIILGEQKPEAWNGSELAATFDSVSFVLKENFREKERFQAAIRDHVRRRIDKMKASSEGAGLTEDNKGKLINILSTTQRVVPDSRKALCQELGLPVDNLPFLEVKGDRNFAIQLVNYLKVRPLALKKLCELLEEEIKGTSWEEQLQEINANL